MKYMDILTYQYTQPLLWGGVIYLKDHSPYIWQYPLIINLTLKYTKAPNAFCFILNIYLLLSI